MKNTIAVSLAVVVVLWAFSNTLFPNFNFSILSFSTEPIFKLMPSANIPAPIDPVGMQAWQIFQEYIKFAHTHNLAGIKSLSYQLSPTCQDPTKTDECNTLMDSVYLISQYLTQNDFSNVYYDDRQIVMVSDYYDTGVSGTMSRIAIFFTRDSEGNPKVLGMKLCFGESQAGGANCVKTNPKDRDLDHNGWWDDVEAKFNK